MSKNDGSNPKNVIKSDLTDRLFFNDVADQSTKIKTLCGDQSPARDLCQDVFSSLYRYRPEVQPDAPAPQRQMIEQMMNLPEYKSLVGDTRGDELLSAMGTTALAPKLVDQLEQVQKKIEEKQKEREENGEGDAPAGFEDLSNEDQAALRAGMRTAMKDAQEEGEQTKQMLMGWGAEPGELKKLPLGDKMRLVEQLKRTPKFNEITELVGRFRNVANAIQATSFKHGQDEIVDIELGNDIPRLLPSELLKFQNTPLLFFKDYLEGNLMQFQMKGTEDMGRGPIITLFDVSPSMEWNGAFVWCKAATLTLMEVCRKQKRAFGAIAFEAKVVFSQFWTKGSTPTIQDKLHIADLGTTGGTEFMAPLREAFRQRALDSDLKPADFVFITDGACQMKPEDIDWIIEMKKKTSVRIFGIGIGSGSVHSIKLFCDEVVLLERDGAVHRMQEIEKLMGAVTAR